MAKVQYNEVTPKRAIVMDGDPWIVLSNSISKKDRQKASNNVKLKNARTGSVVDRTFHQSDVFDEAEIEKRDIVFIFYNAGKGEYMFHDAGNPGARFPLSDDVVGPEGKWLKEKTELKALTFEEEVIGVQIPVKVELVVTEASEAVKGNTSSGATKEVTVETGATLQVPQFINQGDSISINTETGQYAERVEKA
jgi:elongation factor P